jgi:hypothetical protein
VKHRLILLSGLVVLLLGATFVIAHPHFNKTLTVKLPSGAEATLTYNTIPANEMHPGKAAVGSFVTPRQPRLKLSAEIKAGAVVVPAGEYVIGAIKNGDKDWTMGLYPGTIARGASPEMDKVIKLESAFSSEGKADHMLIDITPGQGKFEGRAVLTLHFGTMFLAGALS